MKLQCVKCGVEVERCANRKDVVCFQCKEKRKRAWHAKNQSTSAARLKKLRDKRLKKKISRRHYHRVKRV